ncbi:hypothetical protein K432DRAFT_385224 [Lepidopterella palustris CBS 459.81]|uniref:Uncharacterized protein n=1 Tax=Lepidopterella palustris CBS 459.81 TaxID=1314670 RepID=A0A8E2E3I5_9PEZI|nr:hypothetical protein K432DRAFT_385224 [Lepidopterella palustris CBS 459.81]
MTCNITNTPTHPEPLPLYRRDPDAVSVHSAAPSYVSEAPTYTSRRPSIPAISTPTPTTTGISPPAAAPSSPLRGLPSPRYAPGFQSRAHGSISDVEIHNYNISHWSSINSSHASRQYHAVARRRASQAANTAAILNSLAAVPPPLTSPAATGPGSNTSSSSSSIALNNSGLPTTGAGSASSSYPSDITTTATNPLEDPYLVGEEAAGRARAQRIYREMCLRGEEAVRYEGKAWEFMLAQMADWKEREESWGQFREQVGRTKLLGRRIGLRS